MMNEGTVFILFRFIAQTSARLGSKHVKNALGSSCVSISGFTTDDDDRYQLEWNPNGTAKSQCANVEENREQRTVVIEGGVEFRIR